MAAAQRFNDDNIAFQGAPTPKNQVDMFTTLADVPLDIAQIVDSIVDANIIRSSSCIAIIWKNGDSCTVDISSPNFRDDSLFYLFYLGHRIDCIKEITTAAGHDILVYPNCSSEMAKLILSSAFIENDFEVDNFSEDMNVNTLVDEYFI